MASEAKILVPNGQQLRVYRAMRRVANGAAFAQCGMFKYKRSGLFPMALCARFVQTRHCQSSCRFHDVQAVRIVALRAVHLPFENRVMLREMELGVNIQMALKTRLGILSGIDDELFPSCPANGDMFTPWPVTRFASARARHCPIVTVKSGMRTCGKCSRNVCMAIGARFVADESRPLDHWRGNDGALNRRTGNSQQKERAKDCGEPNPKNDTLDFRLRQSHAAHKLGIGIYKSPP
jgi:hypothetical protein